MVAVVGLDPADVKSITAFESKTCSRLVDVVLVAEENNGNDNILTQTFEHVAFNYNFNVVLCRAECQKTTHRLSIDTATTSSRDKTPSLQCTHSHPLLVDGFGLHH